MLDIFLKIADSIFPPIDSIKKLRTENPTNFLRHFNPQTKLDCVILSDYTNPFIKAAVTANKFHDYEKASILLASLIKGWIHINDSKLPIIFVPIPLSSKRLKDRGYNQVTRVLEKISLSNLEIKKLLIRNIDTKPQTSLARNERLKNIENAFSYNSNDSEDYIDKLIVIVDDVLTTGATIKTAYKVLSENLPKDSKIICLALAH